MSQSEKDLIVQCQKGNTEAFGQLYDNHVKTIYTFVYYKTLNKDVAEDLTSQTFFKALNKIDTVDPSRSFLSWLYKIAQNTVFDHFRSKREHIDIDDAWDIAEEETMLSTLDEDYDMKRVKLQLHQLSQLERDIIFMRVWQELSYKEIAESVGKSESNCKVIYSRAMQKLRSSIGEGTYGQSD